MSEIKNELEVQDTTELAVAGPVDMRGYEDMDMSEMTIPVVKLMQPTSPELTDEDYDLKMGQIINSLSKETLETFIPLKFYKDRIMFVPKSGDTKYLEARVKEVTGEVLSKEDLKEMFVCRSEDNVTGSRFGECSNCPFAKFEGNNKPLCSQNINTVALFGNNEGLDMLPTLIRFAATSKKHGDTFYKLSLVIGRGKPLFSRKYKLLSLKKQQDGKTWFELTVKPAGILKQEAYAQAETMYEMFASRDSFKVEEDSPFVEEKNEEVVEVKPAKVEDPKELDEF